MPKNIQPPTTNQLPTKNWQTVDVWHATYHQPQQPLLKLIPMAKAATPALHLLKAIDQQKNQLLENTILFAKGFQVNNALLWGSRGTGKSSLVKSVHAHVNQLIEQGKLAGIKTHEKLLLVEIDREDLHALPQLLQQLPSHRRSIIFCDDLSFEAEDVSYKSLKSLLEGGVMGRPEYVVFYATSNRRHLIPRQTQDNPPASLTLKNHAGQLPIPTDLHANDQLEEKLSLSDRFGLWLGFHKITQENYLAMIEAYIQHYQIPNAKTEWQPQAIEWSLTRGQMSGRTAWQFILTLAAKTAVKL